MNYYATSMVSRGNEVNFGFTLTSDGYWSPHMIGGCIPCHVEIHCGNGGLFGPLVTLGFHDCGDRLFRMEYGSLSELMRDFCRAWQYEYDSCACGSTLARERPSRDSMPNRWTVQLFADLATDDWCPSSRNGHVPLRAARSEAMRKRVESAIAASVRARFAHGDRPWDGSDGTKGAVWQSLDSGNAKRKAVERHERNRDRAMWRKEWRSAKRRVRQAGGDPSNMIAVLLESRFQNGL